MGEKLGLLPYEKNTENKVLRRIFGPTDVLSNTMGIRWLNLPYSATSFKRQNNRMNELSLKPR
jgi:hypothetical protein